MTIALTLPTWRYQGATRSGRFTPTRRAACQLPGARAWLPPTWFRMEGVCRASRSLLKDSPPALPVRSCPLATASFRRTTQDAGRQERCADATFHTVDARAAAVPLIRWVEQQPLPDRFGESQAPPAAVINEHGEADLARRGRWDVDSASFSARPSVVGVVADARNAALSDEPVAEFYSERSTGASIADDAASARAMGSRCCRRSGRRSPAWTRNYRSRRCERSRRSSTPILHCIDSFRPSWEDSRPLPSS